ncbi:hypothetical protein BCR41DRAFT_343992 [Lobosporangium transversale]|uniref:Uncharacterized protein n=1 Tax=Lobosporangium transversale TaxID=64571 RepID=A0A1Y2H2G3_9FUNG|nr:hypothetical protein BCR41DRAFT_343992 [Lobosporangium transversale]ORZ28747.1 hypothetical protein BCR41DRAFT_343992 [Lobosporangium transversale]|eukprot:XP_021886420.1 hypothetical protein BCR41DRAFT_343992 [Lobosporangium transversale]
MKSCSIAPPSLALCKQTAIATAPTHALIVITLIIFMSAYRVKLLTLIEFILRIIAAIIAGIAFIPAIM